MKKVERPLNNGGPIIDPHGGYRELKAYQNTEIIYDATVKFCERFIDRRSRTTDQMVQAARSGKQNIAEGSMASGTSKKTELKLVGVARASLEELLLDYQDFLRQHRLSLWTKEHPRAQKIRKLAYEKNRSYMTYRTYVEDYPAQVAANVLLSASSTRPITCWTSCCVSWRLNSCGMVVSPRGCTTPERPTGTAIRHRAAWALKSRRLKAGVSRAETGCSKA